MKLFIVQVMTAMAEPADIPVLSRPVEAEGVMAAIKDETSLVEAFENNFDISQDVKPAASAASEEMENREKPDDDDDEEDRQQDEEKESPPDGQQDEEKESPPDGQQDEEKESPPDGQQDEEKESPPDRQQDEEKESPPDGQQDEEKESPPEGQPTVDPPAAEPSGTETKWTLGAACRAVWSEDRTVYPAIVVSLYGERCRVRFNDYGNYKDLALSELQAPDDAPQRPIENCLKPPLDEEDRWIEPKALDWKPGSRCRAVYSEDSMVYPAVILWVKGERCCVRFDGYENEEEQEVSALLSLGALHGNSMSTAAKGSNWKQSATTSGSKTNVDWKRRRREENQGERAGREENQGARAGRERRSGGREEEQQQNFSWLKGNVSNNHQRKVEKESEEKQNDETQTPPNNMFSFFPPFAPQPPGSGDSMSFIPPPPPLWTFGSSAGTDASSSMLMLWYMCGFHTGSYMAQQAFNSNSTD